MDDLQARRDQLSEERERIETRLSILLEHQEQQTQQAALTATVEAFCRHIQAALQQPGFETKQKILRLLIQKIVVTDEQITIHHMIPLPDVRLQRRQYGCRRPYCRKYEKKEDRVNGTQPWDWNARNGGQALPAPGVACS